MALTSVEMNTVIDELNCQYVAIWFQKQFVETTSAIIESVLPPSLKCSIEYIGDKTTLYVEDENIANSVSKILDELISKMRVYEVLGTIAVAYAKNGSNIIDFRFETHPVCKYTASDVIRETSGTVSLVYNDSSLESDSLQRHTYATVLWVYKN